MVDVQIHRRLGGLFWHEVRVYSSRVKAFKPRQRMEPPPGGPAKKGGMRVAVVGCSHGELEKMYETIAFIEKRENTKVDLLVCCGDFQSVRNATDLSCLACPPKYRSMREFYKYYSGERKAPVPTLFVGGNHEASNALLELFHGGWVAPNIWYLGMAGVVNFGGLRIGGISGIFKRKDFCQGHWEAPPFNDSSLRSIYHVREYDVWKLAQLAGPRGGKPLDIFLSHDWPQGIYHKGDTNNLIRRKRFLKEEIQSNSLGNPPIAKLLDLIQPDYWFSAHLHVKFAAMQEHSTGRRTKFLALSKVLPGHDFMQIIDFPEATGPKQLEYDPHWLAIMRSTNKFLSLNYHQVPLPHPQTQQQQKWEKQGFAASDATGKRTDFSPTKEELNWVKKKFEEQDKTREEKVGLKVPLNFVQTAPTWDPAQGIKNPAPPIYTSNPQTAELLKLLEIPDLITEKFATETTANQTQQSNPQNTKVASSSANPSEILLATPKADPAEIGLSDLSSD